MDKQQRIRNMLESLAQSLTCGNCGEITSVESQYTCRKCGRVLCEKCGKRWGWCKFHVPTCTHSETSMVQIPGVQMIGLCQHNMVCPVCGYGWGANPDPCDATEGVR